MLRLWKTGHWRRNVEPLTKAKEKLRVKSKFVVCSTEKSSSSKSRWNKNVVNKIGKGSNIRGLQISVNFQAKKYIFSKQ